MVNIGQRIREELTNQERTISWLTRKLNCNRSTVYRILEKNSIDTLMLAQISQILNYNFMQELSDDMQQNLEE